MTLSRHSSIENKDVNNSIGSALELIKNAYLSKNLTTLTEENFTKLVSTDKGYFKKWQKKILMYLQKPSTQSLLNNLHREQHHNVERVDMVMYLYSKPNFNEVFTFKHFFSELPKHVENDIGEMLKKISCSLLLDEKIKIQNLYSQFVINAKDLSQSDSIKKFTINKLADFEDSPDKLIDFCLSDLGIESSQQNLYLLALYNYLKSEQIFKDFFKLTDDHNLMHQLAMRIAIDWIYFQFCNLRPVKTKWLNHINSASEILSTNKNILKRAFIWQELLSKNI